jgi:hypothetical protein
MIKTLKNRSECAHTEDVEKLITLLSHITLTPFKLSYHLDRMLLFNTLVN